MFPTDTMAEHRARSLSVLLPIALATGYSEIEPHLEPLKVRVAISVASGISNEYTELRLRS